ncbi:hypothetical protein TSTA_066480 [Talaromyces stipitatus ATCC 10500]|uniref:Uncharacterized protein n=1 Tax=Talaromyces stipitatus (strain ATCC 10500 / CBS 375.48 / QM 6759 / NRRL 1006) TaxID=441959 RepID=B8LXC0_TALSN|nr:uncharacterized protein TSTA_066480 [Talaromyces stipitatus ATCC 10500]EED23201.1 hypothetical protein TSTA_066480 [Talaromyces stipitatus ATCC 10500]
MAVEATAIVSAATENTGQQPQCRSGSKGLEDNLRKQPPANANGMLTYRGHCLGIRSDNQQHVSHNGEASPGISAGFLEHERSCSAYQETTERINGLESNTMHAALSSDSRSGTAIPADTAHLDDMDLLHASSAAPNLTMSPNITLITESVKNQGVLGEKRTPDPDSSPSDMILSESRETSLVVRNSEDNEDIPSSLGGEHSTTNTALGCSQDPSLSSRGEQNGDCLGENNTVTVVIPAARPPKPHAKRSAKRPYRRRPKRQTSRTAPFDEEDDSDDPDDDDYVEQTPQVDDRYRPTKKPRQLPVTNSDRSDVGAAVGFQLGGLSLPDLRTVQRGVLTCEFFPSQIMYSFSWAEDRGCSDDCPPNDDNTLSKGDGRSEMNGIQGWDLDTSSKDVEDEATENIDDNQPNSRLNSRKPGCGGKRRRKKAWTVEEDARLKLLKEKDNLSWSQILKHFPNRTEGALQFRYSKYIKNSTSRPSVTPSHDVTDRNITLPSSPHSSCQQHEDRPSQSATELTLRSRYGPARCRRTVERYSP